MKTIIHFAHIPKCGGSSLREGLLEAYGDQLQLHYVNPLRHRFIPRVQYAAYVAQRKWKRFQTGAETKIVYGHFCFDKMPLPEECQIVRGAFFREPIDWLGSYFFYMRAKYPQEIPDDPIWLTKRIRLDRGFRAYLGRFGVEDLEYVGISEEYSKSLDLFSSIFGYTVKNKTANVTKQKPESYRAYFREIGVEDVLENLMSDNKEIYEKAKQKYHRLINEHLS